MSSPDPAPQANPAPTPDAPAVDAPAPDAPTAEAPTAEAPTADAPAPDATGDDEVIDAELVPTPDTAFTPQATTPAFDYTDAGVPTLDYLRDRIEKRLGTAEGSAELAGAQDAQERQRKADEERAEKAAAKLAEIRRQVTEGR